MKPTVHQLEETAYQELLEGDRICLSVGELAVETGVRKNRVREALQNIQQTKRDVVCKEYEGIQVWDITNRSE